MTVTLSGQGNGIVMADAVKIVPNTTSATQASAFNIYTDHLNTPREIRNHANQLRWTWYPEVSGAFGAGLPNENPNTPALGVFAYNLRFPGQLYDPTSQLSYNYYRDYSSRTGRYIESDPIGLEGGINTYSYVGGNPLSYVDPFGLLKLNLFDPSGEPNPDVGQAFNNAISSYADNLDICLVYAHGTDTYIADDRAGHANRVNLDAKKLAEVLKTAGCTPQMPVVLNSCNTGKGKNPIGKNLTDYFIGGVSAPNRQMWFNKANQPNFFEKLIGKKPITGPSQIYGKDDNGMRNLSDPGEMRSF